MDTFQAAPVRPALKAGDPAARELIVAANLSASREPGRTEGSRAARHGGRRPVLADRGADVAADVAAGPGERIGSGENRYRRAGRQVGGKRRAGKSDHRK